MKWTCTCGQVELEVDEARGSRLVCYCGSCQEFMHRFGHQASLDAAGGSDLYQTAADGARFVAGHDKVQWMRLTQKGPLRWYASCCGVPMANTLATRSFPFLTILTHRIDTPERLGPVVARVNRAGATGHIDGEAGSLRRALLTMVGRALKARLTGAYRRNPFFDAAGTPIAAGKPPPANGD